MLRLYGSARAEAAHQSVALRPGLVTPSHPPAHSPAPHQLISRAGQRVRGTEAQRMATGQRRGRQAPLAGPTAVVGDAEGAALVVVQSAACGGRQRVRDAASTALALNSNPPPPPLSPFLQIWSTVHPSGHLVCN